MKKLLILFLFLTHFLFAADDSLKVTNKVFPLKYYTINQFEYPDSVSYVMNELQSFHNYLPRNTFGNSGLPFNDFIYKTNFPFGFNYARNYYYSYFYTPSSLNFYNTRIPYTDLFYVFGVQKEQFFKMTFSYNIKKNWNMTANFSRIKSLGFYIKQKTDHTFFSVSSNYKTLDNRYMLLVSGAVNSIKNEENGGMVNDSFFFKGNVNYTTSLSDAKTVRLNKNIFLRQYLNLGHKVNDSALVATTSRFILTSVFDENSPKYLDSNPKGKYYKHIYYDSTKTQDSVCILRIENELAWKRVDNLKHRGILDMIGLGVSIKHQYIHLEQSESRVRDVDTVFNNILAGAELTNLYSKNKFFWKLSGSYGLKGYNKEDFEYSGLLTKVFKENLSRISLNLKAKEYAPLFMYNLYNANNFKWLNHFEKSKEQTIAASLFSNKYNLAVGVDVTSYSNVLYFDTAALAQQYIGTIRVLSVSLMKNFKFYNFHLNNKINYQQVPDSSVIRVPEFILQHSLYYENDLFKKALRLQIGFQVLYNTSYYANAYMPSTGQFYLQNKSSYGSYPVIDFFLNMKIKVVNAFFKIDHLNSGFSGNTYMLTPHYILNQRAFRLGVSWKFWD